MTIELQRSRPYSWPLHCGISREGVMAVNSPGEKEEDPEPAIHAKRQDGVREAGWDRAMLGTIRWG